MDKHLVAFDQFGNIYGPLDPRAPKRSLLASTNRATAYPVHGDNGEIVGYAVSSVRGDCGKVLYCDFYWQGLDPFYVG